MDNLESVVFSTRIRLARNFADYPFPNKLKSGEIAKEIVDSLVLPLSEIDKFNLSYVDRTERERLDILKENYLISPLLIAHKGISAVFINQDETVSVMVNEEDHVREQYVVKGFQLHNAYEYLSGIDDVIADCVDFAYDQTLGYLTACPSNLGTGLRASVMLCLPAIAADEKRFSELVKKMRSLGMTVRGAYGEGSAGLGYMYQISNEVTLGLSEREILDAVYEATYKIADVEIRARKEAYENDPVAMRDACGRAYGVLRHCERISYAEFAALMGKLKMGISLGLYTAADGHAIDDLLLAMRDSNVERFFKTALGAERDVYRAKYVRKKIAELIGFAE